MSKRIDRDALRAALRDEAEILREQLREMESLIERGPPAWYPELLTSYDDLADLDDAPMWAAISVVAHIGSHVRFERMQGRRRA